MIKELNQTLCDYIGIKPKYKITGMTNEYHSEEIDEIFDTFEDFLDSDCLPVNISNRRDEFKNLNEVIEEIKNESQAGLYKNIEIVYCYPRLQNCKNFVNLLNLKVEGSQLRSPLIEIILKKMQRSVNGFQYDFIKSFVEFLNQDTTNAEILEQKESLIKMLQSKYWIY